MEAASQTGISGTTNGSKSHFESIENQKDDCYSQRQNAWRTEYEYFFSSPMPLITREYVIPAVPVDGKSATQEINSRFN